MSGDPRPLTSDEISLMPDDSRRPEPDVPYCLRHFVQMRVYSTKKKQRYWRCPVDGCEERDCTERKHHPRVPTEPHWCPICAAGHKELVDSKVKVVPGKQVAMELVLGQCTTTKLHFVCPACHHIERPFRPDLQAVMTHASRRGASVDDL